MVVTISPDTEARILEAEQGRHRRLLARAHAMQLQADPDYCRADACVMWQPAVLGRCEVVSLEGCSCHEYKLWRHCPHFALLNELTGKGGRDAS